MCVGLRLVGGLGVSLNALLDFTYWCYCLQTQTVQNKQTGVNIFNNNTPSHYLRVTMYSVHRYMYEQIYETVQYMLKFIFLPQIQITTIKTCKF